MPRTRSLSQLEEERVHAQIVVGAMAEHARCGLTSRVAPNALIVGHCERGVACVRSLVGLFPHVARSAWDHRSCSSNIIDVGDAMRILIGIAGQYWRYRRRASRLVAVLRFRGDGLFIRAVARLSILDAARHAFGRISHGSIGASLARLATTGDREK
ncbi:MAG TPA: hypothetical protein VGI14_22805 [Casimicrobiaceae bacterium]|jgi:hypothetical protein